MKPTNPGTLSLSVKGMTCTKLLVDPQARWRGLFADGFSPEQSTPVSSGSFCQSRLHAPSSSGWELLRAQRPLTLPCPPSVLCTRSRTEIANHHQSDQEEFGRCMFRTARKKTSVAAPGRAAPSGECHNPLCPPLGSLRRII